MAFVAGNFDDAAYNKVKVTMMEIMSDEAAYGHLRQPTTIFDCIATKQTIKINGPQTMTLLDGRRCEGVDVSWLNLCDLDVSEATVDCVLDGDELGAQKKTYVPNLAFHKSFKVPDSQCKDVHDYNEKVALAILGIRAALDQELERRIITFLEAQADDLTGVTLPFGALDGGDSTQWNIGATPTFEMFIGFEKVAAQLNLVSPQIIDGNNFYSLIKAADSKIGGSCCNTDKLRELLPLCANFKTVDQVSGGERTYMIDSTNVAYFNTVINRNSAPIAKGDKDNTRVWSIPSLKLKWKNGNTLEPVMYDIKHQYQCVTGNDYQGVFHGSHNGAFITGPTNCNERVGIVKMEAD